MSEADSEAWRPEDRALGGFLEDTIVVDWQTPAVFAKAREIAQAADGDAERAGRALDFVQRDIANSFDEETQVITCRASHVLQHRTGVCYAKSHLLAALLRCIGIPCGFVYVRVRSEFEGPRTSCLHGFNAAYLESSGRWCALDASAPVSDAGEAFDPAAPRLRHALDSESVLDICRTVFTRPLPSVLDALERVPAFDRLAAHLPDAIA